MTNGDSRTTGVEAPEVDAPITATRPSPLKALGLLVAAILLVGGFLVLSGLLHNTEFYIGFLFLFCWTLIEHSRMDRLPHTIAGAVLGLALGFALHELIGGLGATGGYIFGALFLPILYCQLMGWLSLFVNATAMAFLLVATIPYVQTHGDFLSMAISLALGFVFFVPILWIGMRVGGKH